MSGTEDLFSGKPLSEEEQRRLRGHYLFASAIPVYDYNPLSSDLLSLLELVGNKFIDLLAEESFTIEIAAEFASVLNRILLSIKVGNQVSGFWDEWDAALSSSEVDESVKVLMQCLDVSSLRQNTEN